MMTQQDKQCRVAELREDAVFWIKQRNQYDQRMGTNEIEEIMLKE